MKKRVLAALAAAVVSAVMLSGCAGGAGPAGTHADTLAIGTMTVPGSLDPKDASGSAMPFFQAVYDTLIHRAPDGTLEPMLATEWTYDDSGTVLSLTLRDDVTFDDGTPFDATAAKANLDRFRDAGGPDAVQIAGVTVDVQDATHLSITLPQPNPGLLFYLTDSIGLMANPARFATDDALVTTPDGTGPFTLNTEKTAIGTSWVYDRRDDYWGEESDFRELTISVFDNENAMVNGLKTGQLDSAVLQDADQQLAVEQDAALTGQTVTFDFQGVLLFDRGGVVTPALADPKVRQALNYALDRKTMLDVVRDGRGEVTSQVWGRDSAGFDESLDGYYDYDPAKAKALLAEAGYADGFELVLPRLTTIVTDNIASALQTDLAAVGVTLTWADVEPATALKQIFVEKKFSGMVMNMGQSSNDWLVYATLIAPGTFNFFGTTDDTVQRLAGDARAAGDGDAASIYHELNEHIVEQAWFLPFYRLNYQLVSVNGIDVAPQAGMAVPSIYNYSLAE
ncbi:ABC transporter substrate-binding protein [Microbacterium nymphoidis]|uniref:ABC transporter substrate-binding protein n=1 Tax=Microbacterium nymphoidis TaxID=2898586 RepID=UPI001E47EC9B|nr:ABC transporter substrate-binding protein [Microbacterium nymphoidis]MCD2499094.1 ABC transporter substrate-binding protein [Microbacterium nymphoidis]